MSDFELFVRMGFNHVADWKAYDHLLFMALLAIPYTFKDWKRVVLLVTVFTLGHTLTSLLAVYGDLAIAPSLIEFLIPATIVVTGIYNLITARKPTAEVNQVIFLLITFFFGGIHGLGFSRYFIEMTRGIEGKLLPLLEFSLGVELAQILVLILFLLLNVLMTGLLRYSRREWVQIGSAIVIGMAIPMLLERM